MIRRCESSDLEGILEIINDAARVYRGIIPLEYCKEPYMSYEELRNELDDGIVLYGYEEKGKLVGVMGIQNVRDVTLIRHAYVLSARQNQGIGGKLLSFLRKLAPGPILIATWSTMPERSDSMKNMDLDWYLLKRDMNYRENTGPARKSRSGLQLFLLMRNGL